VPVQIVHSVTSMRDGAPGESRSIVLTRRQGDEGRRPVCLGRVDALYPLLQQYADGDCLGRWRRPDPADQRAVPEAVLRHRLAR
jgi:hypothetical protein